MRRVWLHLRLVLFEPASNIQHFGDVVAGAAADAVRFLGDAYEDGVNIQEFQRCVELFGLGDGSAVVGLTGHDHRGGLYLCDETGEGTLHVVVGSIPGIPGEPIFGDEGNVGSEREAVPVDDRIERSRGAEAISVLDGPTGENTAPAAAGDEEIIRVDIALGDDGVDPAIQVVEIVTGIGVMDEVGKVFAVAGAAARIGVEHDVAPGGEYLFFKVKAVTVVGKGAAMNLKDERIFFCRIEIGRMDDPTLNLVVVFRRFEPDLLDVTRLFLFEQFLIERSQDFHRTVIENGEVAGIVRTAVGEGDQAIVSQGKRAAAASTRRGSEVVGDFLEGSFRGVEADFGVALIIVAKIDARAVRSPLGILNVAVELIGEGARTTAVPIHQEEFGALVTLIAVVVAGVSDEFSVG